MRILPQVLGRELVDYFLAVDTHPCVPGRQGTGYFKGHVRHEGSISFLWRLFPEGTPVERDSYLLFYPQGSHIPLHTDPAPEGHDHYRLNILLAGPTEGLVVDGVERKLEVGDGYLFRPDLELHEVKPIVRETRVVLSLGALFVSSKSP